jgi:hypothetical protein
MAKNRMKRPMNWPKILVKTVKTSQGWSKQKNNHKEHKERRGNICRDRFAGRTVCNELKRLEVGTLLRLTEPRSNRTESDRIRPLKNRDRAAAKMLARMGAGALR